MCGLSCVNLLQCLADYHSLELPSIRRGKFSPRWRGTQILSKVQQRQAYRCIAISFTERENLFSQTSKFEGFYEITILHRHEIEIFSIMDLQIIVRGRVQLYLAVIMIMIDRL